MTMTLNPINMDKINKGNPVLDFHLSFLTMALNRIDELLVKILCFAIVDALAITHDSTNFNNSDELKSDPLLNGESDHLNNAFNGVYSECFLHLSYTCLQKKTLLYIRELDTLSEISVLGDYVKFVKLNISETKNDDKEDSSTKSSEQLSHMIDKAVDNFFNNHLIRLNALGKDVLVPNSVEEFVGRKRRKGGGGGHGGGGGGGDGGKKKMMMMAMMCMKMKLMMMVPAMMGMMGMMSFKGMMFSMMSFMISKMMLLMKILEKKGGGGGAGGGGGDGSWASGGGGGAWMPAGGQDYGGGGGYDSNAQWTSRSILEKEDKVRNIKPVITYIKPVVRYNSDINNKKIFAIKNLNDEVIKSNNKIDEPKSRSKRSLMDVLQNAYMYWSNKVLGLNRIKHTNYHKHRIVNGVKYYYYPIRQVQKVKTPKELPVNNIKTTDFKPLVIADFNKGEIVEGAESRMNRKKFHKMKENVNETLDDNPWE